MRDDPNYLLSTGISGLDSILSGGLPRGHMYLIDGAPGTGKTTLGLQFLLHGASQGETVLYVTLAETERELREVAASHRWNIDPLRVFELLPEESSLQPEEQYTVLYPGEVELSQTIRAILQRLEALQPTRVVFDSLGELRLLAREQLRFRRQILALKQYFAGRDCTVLLLDDGSSHENERDLQSIVHGVVKLQNLPREYGARRRRLEVLKLRAAQYREGFHDYEIRTGGLRVYPRLVASEHAREFSAELVESGVEGLDSLLGGGIHMGTSTLVMGPAGAGKSTIGLHYAVSCAKRGQHAFFITFDETMVTLRERAGALGLPIDALMKGGNLVIEVADPAELSPGYLISRIRQEVEEAHARMVVVDSLNGLLAAMPGEEFLTMQLHELLAYLNICGVASLLILAQYGILGAAMSTPIDVSYLSDTILLLRYFENAGSVRQAISVVKKRSGAHERTIRELRFSRTGVTVGNPLTQFHGVLTGVPAYTGPEEPLLNTDPR